MHCKWSLSFQRRGMVGTDLPVLECVDIEKVNGEERKKDEGLFFSKCRQRPGDLNLNSDMWLAEYRATWFSNPAIQVRLTPELHY